MRRFNTFGPCNPEEHYTLLRPGLVAQGLAKVRAGRYFTLFAPRQAGKTTFFQLLLAELEREENFLPLWISLENMKTLSREEFYEALNHEMHQELSSRRLELDVTVQNQISLKRVFEGLKKKRVVLVIDEFESIPNSVLSELLHTFRSMYHKKQFHGLHALMLVGVSTVAELVVSSASPFNIVDQLAVPYFTREEVEELIAQYVSESGQRFEAEVVRALAHDTNGQPGLVCALCEYLVETVVPDKSLPITMTAYYRALQHFLTERYDKNILNIVQKAREKKAFMLRLLFSGNPIAFTVHEPEIAYLSAHGVVENVEGVVDIAVPLYKKCLITAFRPTINGEGSHYLSVHENLKDYVTAEGLSLNAILQRYVEYVAKRGFRAFDTENLRESAWHYSLDGFINFFIERLGGQTLVEVPSGRGRTDILILLRDKKYVIETKIYTDQSYFEQGKQQLAEYLKTEGLAEGFYVVFSHKHAASDTLYFEEVIEGKRIVSYIVRVNFERPSRGRKKAATRTTRKRRQQ